MDRPRRAGGLVALALLAGGCGPTAREIGQAVLWAAPIITLVVVGFAWLYARLWRPLLDRPVRIDVRPTLVVAVIQVLLALATLFSPELDGELIGTAVWAVGASYLTFQVIALRLALQSSRAYSWALLAPWMVLYPGAVILGLFAQEHYSDMADTLALLWILPGYAGWVTAPLVLVAFVEIVVRRRRVAPPPPPDLPRARARIRR